MVRAMTTATAALLPLLLGAAAEARIPFPFPTPLPGPRCSQLCNLVKGDGRCDPECFDLACRFDGGDCDEDKLRKFWRSTCMPNCTPQLKGNGECDIVCATPACGMDDGDCPAPLMPTPVPAKTQDEYLTEEEDFRRWRQLLLGVDHLHGSPASVDCALLKRGECEARNDCVLVAREGEGKDEAASIIGRDIFRGECTWAPPEVVVVNPVAPSAPPSTLAPSTLKTTPPSTMTPTTGLRGPFRTLELVYDDVQFDAAQHKSASFTRAIEQAVAGALGGAEAEWAGARAAADDTAAYGAPAGALVIFVRVRGGDSERPRANRAIEEALAGFPGVHSAVGVRVLGPGRQGGGGGGGDGGVVLQDAGQGGHEDNERPPVDVVVLAVGAGAAALFAGTLASVACARSRRESKRLAQHATCKV